MATSVALVKPTISLKDAYLSFYHDWLESEENMVPWVISKDPADFQGMLQFLFANEKGEHLPKGWVPDSTFWLITEDKQVVGAANIRHALTEKLMNSGGHIGYGIRPSERRKGYAAKLLALALEEAQQLGIRKALIVCDESNIASERTIIRNGGVPDIPYVEENGNVIKRFWISLE
jgi:predicted acetyltransferase